MEKLIRAAASVKSRQKRWCAPPAAVCCRP